MLNLVFVIFSLLGAILPPEPAQPAPEVVESGQFCPACSPPICPDKGNPACGPDD